MAKATAGGFPDFTNISETTLTGRQRKTLRAGDFEWELSTGWAPKRRPGWKGRAARNGMIEKVQLTGVDGKPVTVYRTKGYEGARGWHSYDSQTAGAQHKDGARYGWFADSPMHDEVMELGMTAFENDKDYIIQRGRGHIKLLEYNPKRKALRVTFGGPGGPQGKESREDVCVFIGVPTGVAGTLINAAENGYSAGVYSTGRVKHAVGKIFWDLVRIRGQRYGAKYPFDYEKQGTYKLTGRSDRYNVVLSDKNYKLITGKAYTGGEALKPGMNVSVILSPDELARFEELQLGKADEIIKGYTKEGEAHYGDVELYGDRTYDPAAEKTVKDTGYEGLLTGDKLEQYRQYERTLGAGADEIAEAIAQVNGYLNEGVTSAGELAAARKEYETYMRLKDNPEAYEEYLAKHQEVKDLVYKALQPHASEKTAALESAETGARTLGSKEAWKEFRAMNRQAHADKYQRSTMRRAWTVQDLLGYADEATMPRKHRVAYRALLDKGYYAQAFQFLKNHSRELNTAGKVKKWERYAGETDTFDYRGVM